MTWTGLADTRWRKARLRTDGRAIGCVLGAGQRGDGPSQECVCVCFRYSQHNYVRGGVGSTREATTRRGSLY